MDEIPRALIDRLQKGQQRGSKPRCHFLTHGSAAEVASRLTSLIKPWGLVRASDKWMPEGFDKIKECQLHLAPVLLKGDFSIVLQSWWIGEKTNLRTPNWDIASTCLIGGKDGLLLVEAKAHQNELKVKGKGFKSQSKGSLKHHSQIGRAIAGANAALNKMGPSWGLSRDSHYQLSNRFAWSWQLASLGIPVILLYLGFLNAHEMSDQGRPFANFSEWQDSLLDHSASIVPKDIWGQPLYCGQAPFIPLVRSWPTVT